MSGKDESAMDSAKKSQLEKVWLLLKGMKINFVNRNMMNGESHRLSNVLLDLISASNFDKALSLWKGQKSLWRQMRNEWEKLSNLNLKDIKLLSQIPQKDQFVIITLTASLNNALKDILDKGLLKKEHERQYATLLLGKISNEGKFPSDMTDYFKDIAWVLIRDNIAEDLFHETLNRFISSKKVAAILKKKSIKISQSEFTNIINLYGEKYERLQEISSVIDHHAVDEKGIDDVCPVNDSHYKAYARKIAKRDTVLRSVIKSLLLSQLPTPPPSTNEEESTSDSTSDSTTTN